MDLLGHKILVMIVWMIVKMASGILPLFLFSFFSEQRNRSVEKIVGSVLCLGGGVLLATVFIHMLPEVEESLEIARKLGYLPADSHFSFAGLFLCIGFFIIYIIEAIVLKFFHPGNGHSHGVSSIADDNANQSELNNEQVELEGSTSSGDGGGLENAGFVPEDDGRAGATAQNGSSLNPTNENEAGNDNSLNASLQCPDVANAPQEQGPTSDSSGMSEKNILRTMRNILVAIALSLHAVFEGMAVGLQLLAGDVWTLFGAIVIHMIPIHFCIGLDMLANQTSRLHIILYMAAMSVSSNIGVAVGIGVTAHVDATSGPQTLVIGLLQGIAGGTLLYIVFYEVLERGRLTKAGMVGMVGCAFFLLGFAAMTVVEALGSGHSHGDFGLEHGHSHDEHMRELRGGHHPNGYDDHDDGGNIVTAIEQGILKFEGEHGHAHSHDDDHDRDHEDNRYHANAQKHEVGDHRMDNGHRNDHEHPRNEDSALNLEYDVHRHDDDHDHEDGEK